MEKKFRYLIFMGETIPPIGKDSSSDWESYTVGFHTLDKLLPTLLGMIREHNTYIEDFTLSIYDTKEEKLLRYMDDE